jgi:hypothetical protein
VPRGHTNFNYDIRAALRLPTVHIPFAAQLLHRHASRSARFHNNAQQHQAIQVQGLPICTLCVLPLHLISLTKSPEAVVDHVVIGGGASKRTLSTKHTENKPWHKALLGLQSRARFPSAFQKRQQYSSSGIPVQARRRGTRPSTVRPIHSVLESGKTNSSRNSEVIHAGASIA